MMPRHFGKGSRSERGQTIALVLLILGIFLLGVVAFSIDYSNAYFHRQTAQVAADSACTAGIMDLLANAQGNTLGNFPASPASPPNAFLCSANTTAPRPAPCQYAALNGYPASGLVAGAASNEVRISFPGTISGVTPPPNSLAPYPFLQVDVTDRIPTWFAGLVSSQRTLDVGAKAVCALQQAHAPVPIIVLNPSCPHAFEMSGTSGTIAIIGGPSRSIQVNSNNQTCAAATSNGGCSGGPTIDLSEAGPSFNGADFGLFGTPTSAPSGFSGGVGKWNPGATPIDDPYALVNAPAVPSTTPPQSGTPVPYGFHGCPDNKGCTEYQPGLYTSAIVVKGYTAIFDPGLYYIQGTNNDTHATPSSCIAGAGGNFRYGLDVDSNGVIRPANDPVSGYSSGVVFYLTGASGAGSYGSVFFGSNAGKAPGGHTVDSFNTSNFTCPGAGAPPSQLNLPSSVDGNVLLGQCTTSGTWVGATTTSGLTDSAGTVRGLIFFQDRANADAKAQAHMQGGGGLVISGNMYFHNCNSSGTGTSCSNPSAGYNAYLDLQGSPSGGTYVLGNITTDSLSLAGNSTVKMALNPNAVYNILKASLIQ